MAMPHQANARVRIFRGFNPQAPYPPLNRAPAAADVPGCLLHHVRHGRFGFDVDLHWTHVLLLPPGTDIRSAYDSQLAAWDPGRADTVILDDFPRAGRCTAFLVVLAQTVARGTPHEHLRVYLDRCRPRNGPCQEMVQLPCCPGLLPAILHAFLLDNGGCGCVEGTFFQLHFDAAALRWRGHAVLAGCGGQPLGVELWCLEGGTGCADWRLDISGCREETGLGFSTTCNCSPFAIQFLIHDPAGSCCGSAGFFYITIVE